MGAPARPVETSVPTRSTTDTLGLLRAIGTGHVLETARALLEAGPGAELSITDLARATGLDRKTVRKGVADGLTRGVVAARDLEYWTVYRAGAVLTGAGDFIPTPGDSIPTPASVPAGDSIPTPEDEIPRVGIPSSPRNTGPDNGKSAMNRNVCGSYAPLSDAGDFVPTPSTGDPSVHQNQPGIISPVGISSPGTTGANTHVRAGDWSSSLKKNSSQSSPKDLNTSSSESLCLGQAERTKARREPVYEAWIAEYKSQTDGWKAVCKAVIGALAWQPRLTARALPPESLRALSRAVDRLVEAGITAEAIDASVNGERPETPAALAGPLVSAARAERRAAEEAARAADAVDLARESEAVRRVYACGRKAINCELTAPSISQQRELLGFVREQLAAGRDPEFLCGALAKWREDWRTGRLFPGRGYRPHKPYVGDLRNTFETSLELPELEQAMEVSSREQRPRDAAEREAERARRNRALLTPTDHRPDPEAHVPGVPGPRA